MVEQPKSSTEATSHKGPNRAWQLQVRLTLWLKMTCTLDSAAKRLSISDLSYFFLDRVFESQSRPSYRPSPVGADAPWMYLGFGGGEVGLGVQWGQEIGGLIL